MLFQPRFDITTVGSATRDFMFYDHQGALTPHTTADAAGLCFPYGAKVDIGKAYFNFGGGAANVAVNAAVQGWRVATVAAVGDDDTAVAIVKNMRQRGVETKFIEQHQHAQSSFSFVITAGDQREHVIFLYRGASQLLQVPAHVARQIKTRWWYITSLVSNQWRGVLQTILAQPGAKAWNPGGVQLQAGVKVLAPYLSATDILLLNRQEALTLFRLTGTVPVRSLLKKLQQCGPRVVVITNGRQGADAYNGKQYFHQAIVGRKLPVDTTGMGDVHNSTFTMVFDATGGDCAAALRAAARNATAVASKVGAQEGFIKVL